MHELEQSYLVEKLLCYPQVSQMIFHSGGVVLQKGVCVSKGVAGLKVKLVSKISLVSESNYDNNDE